LRQVVIETIVPLPDQDNTFVSKPRDDAFQVRGGREVQDRRFVQRLLILFSCRRLMLL
jgi:hypothetical protein